MFGILQEINDPALLRLTDIQKMLLLVVFAAATPQLAFESANGSEYIVAARNFLLNNGLIITNNGLTVSDNGYDALVNFGLIDESGEISDIGQKASEAFVTMKTKLAEDAIPYKVFKNLNQ